MQRSWGATLALAACLILSLAVFALAPLLWSAQAGPLKLAAALAGLLVVALHAWRSDEVQRRLVLKAGSWAFFSCIALALAVALLETSAPQIVRDQAWAAMMAAWLLAWTILRVRQG